MSLIQRACLAIGSLSTRARVLLVTVATWTVFSMTASIASEKWGLLAFNLALTAAMWYCLFKGISEERRDGKLGKD